MTRTLGTRVAARGDLEIVMTREFDAPRELVYEALTKPALLKQWFGVRNGWTLELCEIDLTVGGKYRYGWKSAKGKPMAMGGVFKEVVPNVRTVATERFDDPWYEGEAITTVELTERDGVTTLTTTMLCENKATRDAVLASPMETGLEESYVMLDKLLASHA